MNCRLAVFSLALGLVGCATGAGSGAPGGFATLPPEERGQFGRCGKALAEALCAGRDREECLTAKSAVFARRPSPKVRRNWLIENGCPAEVVDAPEVAAEAPPAPPPPPAVATVPPAAPTPEPAPAPAPEPAPTPEPAPRPVSPPAPVAAVAPVQGDKALGFACQRSAECESDLCVRGTCATLAWLTAGEPCREPAAAAPQIAMVPVAPQAAPRAATTRVRSPNRSTASREAAPKRAPVVVESAAKRQVASASVQPAPRRSAPVKAEPTKVAPAVKAEPTKATPRPAAPAKKQDVEGVAAPMKERAPAPEVKRETAELSVRRARRTALVTHRTPREASEPAVSRAGAPRPSEDQLRNAIVSHDAEMKKCVERQLKLVPSLRAKGTLVVEVDAQGRVSRAALRGDQLAGTQLEGCLRMVAARWRFPVTAQAYAVEAPLEVSGVE